ncbi:uncharacterized protein M421DRAFT_75520 [Didymella exigua CBS 183.55]|uniref:Uncharacterized protein n=1 Tax=Didymella exigua CBS 183.55 TaxID=1150837 RepID=A0A6A5R5E7_9PLEO|nr:uncharacterized protein M421DRAFT_75520 [Didymella exigua CBS 183.55]KAF1923345.1 hypothetical protein M421DRAFT_75520 [Didymella exigua CBS 183.55]
MYKPRTRVEWAFIGVTATQAIGTSILDIVVLLRYFAWINPVVYQVPSSYVVPLNFGLFILGNVYLAGLAIDALRARNNLQLFGICIFNVGVFVFSLMRFGQTRENAERLARNHALDNIPFVKADVSFWPVVRPVLIVSSVLVGACMVSSWLLTFRLNREFAWAIYRHISGSLSVRRKYLTYQVLVVVMKLDVYFVIAFIIIYGLVDVHYAIPEFPLTMAIIPVLWIQVAMTIVFTKRENKIGAAAALVLRFGEIAYLISRILILNDIPHSGLSNTILKNEMLLFAGCSLALATTACVNATVCILNFNQGLKPLLASSGLKTGTYNFEPIHAQARLSVRLELD